jgi:hypothetical protein
MVDVGWNPPLRYQDLSSRVFESLTERDLPGFKNRGRFPYTVIGGLLRLSHNKFEVRANYETVNFE